MSTVPLGEESPHAPTPATQAPRSPFSVGVVLTAASGREANLRRTWRCVEALDEPPVAGVIVYDGCYPVDFGLGLSRVPLWEAPIPKHEPGRENPRNVGFRILRDAVSVNFVWFVDSDMVFEPDLLTRFREGHEAAETDRILIGPYDWMAPGQTEPRGQLELADGRWQSFRDAPPSIILTGTIGAACACWSGNIVYPVAAFARLGGFHPDLYHGRCEDGELGVRAMGRRIGLSCVAAAQCWHVWHPVDNLDKLTKNARDVDLIDNHWHTYAPSGVIPPEEETYQLEPI